MLRSAALTIFFVHFGDPERVLAILHDVEICLKTPRCSGQFWARKPGERVEEEAIDHQAGQIYYVHDQKALPWDSSKRYHAAGCR